MNVATFFAAGAAVGAVVGTVAGAWVGCTTTGASVTTIVAVGDVAQADKMNVAMIMIVNKICLRCILFSSDIILN
jgi:uncharacterized protein YcfJ